jgi:hypothetical protein
MTGFGKSVLGHPGVEQPDRLSRGEHTAIQRYGVQRMAPKVSNHWLNNPEAPDIEWRIREAINGYAAALVPFIAESYGPDCIQEAWREFVLGSDAQFTGVDAHSELFYSWFFHSWSPLPERASMAADSNLYGIPPSRAYLASYASRLDPLLGRYLAVCLETPFGFYQIVKSFPNSGFRARHVFAGTQIEVIDSLASNSVMDGDIIFARIPSLDGIWVMDAISPVSFPASFRSGLFDRLSAASHDHSDRALRKLYFDLLESYFRESSPEKRGSNGAMDK